MMARSLVRAVVVAGVAVVAWPAAHVAVRADQKEGQKTIYVSVLDDAGKPVKDMTADEFALREDGKDRQIVSVGPAREPLQVVMLVDTSDSAVRLVQDIRTAVGDFIKELHAVRNDAAVELMEFGQAPVPATKFITDDQVLLGALNKLVGKPTADAVLLEAIAQANKDLQKQPSARRAIVALNVEPSNELSQNATALRDGFRKSNAQLWSLSLQSRDVAMSAAGVKPGYEDAVGGNVSAAANAANKTSARNAMLTDFAKVTGGYRDMINGQSAMGDILKRWADALTYQYAVTYVRDSGSPKVVQIGTTRPGVHLHASGYPPQ